LKVKKVGRQENFFDLGGHSLQAMQVISKVAQEYGVRVGPKAVFEMPTIAEQALMIVEYQARQAEEEDFARMIMEIEKMTDEEAARRLSS
jgi:acyl carrier protein